MEKKDPSGSGQHTNYCPQKGKACSRSGAGGGGSPTFLVSSSSWRASMCMRLWTRTCSNSTVAWRSVRSSVRRWAEEHASESPCYTQAVGRQSEPCNSVASLPGSCALSSRPSLSSPARCLEAPSVPAPMPGSEPQEGPVPQHTSSDFRPRSPELPALLGSY